jgi:hypothetical protein
MHLGHFTDGLPLCWSEAEVSLRPAPETYEVTGHRDSVTCDACKKEMSNV